MALVRVFFIGFPNDAGKKAFAEGEYEDSGGFLVRGPVCADSLPLSGVAHAPQWRP